ncbi:MAG: hypothetical protein ABIR36_09840 [Nitrospiraceae bacterium]
MTQEIIVWALLAELVGLIWVMVVGILSTDHHSRHNQQGDAQPQHRNGYKPHEQTSRHSNTPA